MSVSNSDQDLVSVNAAASVSSVPEPCPEPTAFTVDGCRDAIRVPLAETSLGGLGRILQLDVVIKNVCPGKRVAVSILLSELDSDGVEQPRGVKHLLIPAQTGTECRDVSLHCIPFSLPEALDATGNTGSICNARKFHARAMANYVDTDFTCCDTDVKIL